jgi:hypothetical protein
VWWRGHKSPLLLAAYIQMRTTRDFYKKRASALAALAERSKCQDQQSDLLDLARAWRDLAGVWEAPVKRPSKGRSEDGAEGVPPARDAV